MRHPAGAAFLIIWGYMFKGQGHNHFLPMGYISIYAIWQGIALL